MRAYAVLVLALTALVAISGAAAKEDLPPNSKLRVGVLHRPDDCPRKSRDGDRLSMHYTGTVRDGMVGKDLGGVGGALIRHVRLAQLHCSLPAQESPIAITLLR